MSQPTATPAPPPAHHAPRRRAAPFAPFRWQAPLVPLVPLVALLSGCATTSQGWLAASEWLIASPAEVELTSPDGASVSMPIVLSNTGPDAIYASVEVAPEAFTADQSWVSIEPAESTVLTVAFRPSDDGPQDGVLTLVLDGSTRKEIPLHGE